MNVFSRQQGMTLIEIMVVISIISILTTITLVVFTRTTETQKDETRLLNVKTIQVALGSYYDAYGKYPSIPVNSNAITGEGRNCRPISSIQHLLQPYLRTLPVDPDADASDATDPMHYKYSVNNNANPQQYILAVNVDKNNHDTDDAILKQTLYQTDVMKESALFCKCTERNTNYDVRVGSDDYKRLCVGSLQPTPAEPPAGAFHFPKNYTPPTNPLFTPPPSTPGPSSPSSQPLAVGNLSSVTGTGAETLVVSWNVVAQATRYELRYKESSSSVYINFQGTIEPIGTTLAGLTAGTTYNIQVRAIQGQQPPGPWSTTTATTSASTSPDEPSTPPPTTTTIAQVTGLSLTVESSSQIKALWNEVSGVQEYQVERCTGDSTACATGTWTTSSGSSVREANKIAHTFTGLSTGTTYTVRVAGKQGTQTGAYSALATTTTNLAKITGVSATAGQNSTSLSVRWTTQATATGYDVEYRTSASAPSGSWRTETATTSPKSITNLSTSTEYQIRVRSTKGTTQGDYSDIVTQITIPKVAGVTLTPTHNSIAVAWTDVSGATGYDVEYRLTSSAPSGSWRTETSTTNSATLSSSINATTSYQVRVRVKKGSLAGDYSDIATTTTKTLLGKVAQPGGQRYQFRINTIGFTVNWTPIPNASGYIVQHCVSSSSSTTNNDCANWVRAGTVKFIGSNETTNTSYSLPFIGQQYNRNVLFIRVRAKGDATYADGPWSDPYTGQI